jgi:hypothetical protein
MKTTIKLNGTTYTLSSGHATYETKHLTDEQRLQLRVNEITLLANKKHRKPALKKCPRVYPKFGAVQSTAQYVADYYAMNSRNYGKQAAQDEAAQIIAGLYEPLSTTVSVPMGEDTQEQDA